MSKIDKIVIVGGGSAGWMTAAILIKEFPQKKIILIESPNIKSIGVGESTYNGINQYLYYLEINREDFFKKTNASIKLGIEFKNFYNNDGSSFLYPFGIPYIDDTLWGMQDWFVKKDYNKNLPVTDFAKSYFPVAHLIEHNTFFDNNQEKLFPNFDSVLDTAIHFDAIKFADWLKEEYCLPKGVEHILSEVKDVEATKQKINFLLLENNKKIFADLFIDCTGFHALLIDKVLKEPFISYNDVLPNNSAWAVQIEYDNKEKEMNAVTRCTAIENGWCWNVPLWSRLGTGYVYSNNFIEKEDALVQFKNYLSSELMDFPKSKTKINELNFKHIDMRVGIHKRIWVENVVAIGLSAGFIEPLEGNGLFTIHEFLFYLIRSLSKEYINSWDKHVFNMSCKELYDSFVEFITLHYAFSVRNDTEYWKKNIEREYDFENLKIMDYYSSLQLRLFDMKTKSFDPDPSGGFGTGLACISTGMNFFILDQTDIKRGEIFKKEKYNETMKIWFDKLENKKKQWEKIAMNSPKLIDYLYKTYYMDKNV